MATILAGRCKLSDIAAVQVEVVTFGSPRVGTKRCVQNAGIKHVRWVNNNDIVARVPPTWLRYRHTGTRMSLNRNDDVRRNDPPATDERTAGSASRTASRTVGSITSAITPSPTTSPTWCAPTPNGPEEHERGQTPPCSWEPLRSGRQPVKASASAATARAS